MEPYALPSPHMRKPPPMSNLERQRLFCQRHPGYYRRLQANRRAAAAARGVERWEAQQREAMMQATEHPDPSPPPPSASPNAAVAPTGC